MKTVLTFLIIAGFVILLPNSLSSQPVFPNPGMIYEDEVIPRIDILIHPDSLDLIYEFVESDHEFPATFIFNNGTVHDTIDMIGFRLRGNTSRWSNKKSFKVSFNAFFPGRKYYGVEKLNLNGEHNDPSVIRSKLCWDLLQEINIPAPRSNHVGLFINGNYYGLYINVEHIDEEFVLSRFENNDGNLYKCLYPADLQYLGANSNLYKFESNGRRAYELKTNEGLDDYSDLAHFIDVLNNTPIGDLPCALEELFNVYDYLKIIAIDIATANWDGYIYNKNNYYLYMNTSSGKFEYIPYDLDNTFGVDWFGIDWSTRNIYSWDLSQEPRPLYERILQVQRYKNIYSYYLKTLTEYAMDPATWFGRIEAIRDKIFPSVLYDPYYPLDYGYTPSDFLASYTQALGSHIPVGLEPYITQRGQATMTQLILNNFAPVMKYFSHTPAILNQEVWCSIYTEDNQMVQEVMLQLTPVGSSTQFIEMVDDGQHHDREAGDGFFGASAGIFANLTNLELEIKATDNQGEFIFYTCEPILLSIVNPVIPALYINEFMASNESSIADENGNFDDWLEIYNAGSDPVWLGDLYLTDNLGNPDKWQMPDYTLAPGGFLLFWTDEEQEQGPFHTNFKLDKDGEEIGIFGNESLGFPTIDSMIYGVQQTDISYGRYPDAGSTWQSFIHPTPGYSNTTGGSGDDNEKNNRLSFYPNPCSGLYIYLSEKLKIRIYNLTGQLQITTGITDRILVAGLSQGLYIVVDESGRTGKLVINP